MCEEESDDQEAVAKLFEINDSIHRTIERYKLMKKGDVEAAARIPQGTLGTSTGVGKNKDNELSLIDFNDGDAGPTIATSAGSAADLLGSDEPAQNQNPNPNQSPKPESFEDDLLGLSFQDKPFGHGGGIALGFGANTSGCSGPTLWTMADSLPRYPRPIITFLDNTAEFGQSPNTDQDTSAPSPKRGKRTQLRCLLRVFQLQTRFEILDSGSDSSPATSAATSASTISSSVRSIRLLDVQHEPLQLSFFYPSATGQIHV